MEEHKVFALLCFILPLLLPRCAAHGMLVDVLSLCKPLSWSACLCIPSHTPFNDSLLFPPLFSFDNKNHFEGCWARVSASPDVSVCVCVLP